MEMNLQDERIETAFHILRLSQLMIQYEMNTCKNILRTWSQFEDCCQTDFKPTNQHRRLFPAVRKKEEKCCLLIGLVEQNSCLTLTRIHDLAKHITVLRTVLRTCTA